MRRKSPAGLYGREKRMSPFVSAARLLQMTAKVLVSPSLPLPVFRLRGLKLAAAL